MYFVFKFSDKLNEPLQSPFNCKMRVSGDRSNPAGA